MKFIADFHIHSKYSRATSREMDVEHLLQWAKIKGIKLLGTGDFTHPQWFGELKTKLESAEPGLLKLKNSNAETRFILTAEISCIYSKNSLVRKIHLLVFAPSLEIVEKINAHLSLVGNLKSDGRPILGLDAKELVKIILNICPDCFIVPAHIWTPWFSLFGSRSGFDSLEECFEQYSPYIFAAETGLSSDPAMNWRLSALDKIALISNSDSHSPQNIGREANVFDIPLDYFALKNALQKKDARQFLYTIEFFPEEGKYHFDGHRLCNVSLAPEQTKKYQGICPVCRRPLTIGVLSRVEQLADRAAGFHPQGAIPYKSLIPLKEVIADALAVSVLHKEVSKYYNELVNNFGSEFAVLLDVPVEDLQKNSLPSIAQSIAAMREGKVSVVPGYDGVYGKISIAQHLSASSPQNDFPCQGSLF